MQERARRTAPAPLGDLVNRAFHRHGWSRADSHLHVFEAWQSILPAEMRERCRAVSFRAGKLTVAVDSSPLLEDLSSFRAPELLRVLNQSLRLSGRLPLTEVRALDFRRA